MKKIMPLFMAILGLFMLVGCGLAKEHDPFGLVVIKKDYTDPAFPEGKDVEVLNMNIEYDGVSVLNSIEKVVKLERKEINGKSTIVAVREHGLVEDHWFEIIYSYLNEELETITQTFEDLTDLTAPRTPFVITFKEIAPVE